MDDDGGLGRNWGGYYEHEPSRNHLGLQLMSTVAAERDTKSFLGRDSPVMVGANGGAYYHPRDCGVSRVSGPHMEIVRDSWIINDNHRHVMPVPGNTNFPVFSEPSSAQSFNMLQPPDSLKDERVARMEEASSKKDGPLKKRQGGGGRAPKSPKPKKPRKPKDESIPSVPRVKSGKKNTGLVINGIDMDIMGIPTPVCSCTGMPQQCYRWGCGGWQSACCTTSMSMYPLPMSTKRRGARIAGRKMSQGAFKKVLEKLAAEGYNLSNPIDLRSHWAKHGTNKFVTISGSSLRNLNSIWVPFSHDVLCMEKTLDHVNVTVSLRYCKPTCMVKMAKKAVVDRSCGQLVEFSVIDFATGELLYYLSQKSETLRCLHLACCMKVSDDGLAQVCKQFPQLEELELYVCWFSEDVFETVGCLCPYLKSFRLNYMFYTRPYMSNGMALVIAEAMPELRHLNLFGNRLTDVGLRAILGGCPHLQSLDLRRCFILKFEGDLKEMSANMKLRLPYDSTDDFEYPIESFSEDELCLC